MLNQSNNNKRLEWLDIMKGMSMLLIILSHISITPSLYVKLYTPVFLSAFFFCAGYTFKLRDSFKDFIIHKLRTLAVPFVCLGCINAIIAIAVEGDSIYNRMLYLISLRGNWDDLWFIACLFSAQIIFYFVLMVSNQFKNRAYGYAFLIALSVLISFAGVYYVRYVDITLPLQFESACINVVFIALGFSYKSVENCKPLKTRGGGTARLQYTC